MLLIKYEMVVRRCFPTSRARWGGGKGSF